MPGVASIPRTAAPTAPGGRVVYASAVPGVALDCDLRTGSRIGGGTPTDNAAALNAVLATATATAPVRLVIDGGTALGAPLVIPAAGHVTIEGQGWDTGLFMLAGANSSAIQNFPGTDLAEFQAWQPGGATSVAGSDVTIRDLRIHGNRGTYPDGNCDGTPDGTLTGQTLSPDARGLYTGVYWLSGIVLQKLDNVRIEGVWVYDAPAYGVDLYHCTKVWVDRCRIEAASPSVQGNTDGIHVNGGCSSVFITDSWFSTGDDAIGFNVDEGDGQPGGDFLVADCTFVGCRTIGRVYGRTASTHRVTFRDCHGSGIWAWAFIVGNGSGFTPGANRSVAIRDCDVQVTASDAYACFLYLHGPAELIELEGCHLVDPPTAIPMVLVSGANPTVSALRVLDCGAHRTAAGSGACKILTTEAGGSIGEMVVRDFHLTEQRNADGSFGHYADVPAMVDLGSLAVGRLAVSGSFRGAATVVNVPAGASVGSVAVPDLYHASNAGSPAAHTLVNASSATIPVSVGRLTGSNLAGIASGPFALAGPGVMPSGFPVADALMGSGTLYLGSDHGGVPCVKVAGVAKTLNLT